ncbi:MAG TPA: DUF3379 family protein [Woeseiaceae bacterium]|nr:DUF3379 family protein [Woeseiaceae bacterium]
MNEPESIDACVACRAAIAASPVATDDWPKDARTHIEGCADCRAYQATMRAFDADIARALALPVPPLDFDAVPLAGNPADADPFSAARRGPSNSVWLALAATVVLGVIFAARFALNDLAAPSPGTALGEQVLAHIDHESFSLTVSDQAVGSERLARIVPADVARLGPETGLVTYAQSCIINGHAVPHLVVQGQNGPVTILLMPQEKLDAPERIGNGVLSGVLLPVGDGSIAIVGEDPQDLERLEETMKNSVTWRT